MTVVVLDQNEILEEVVVGLRNADILSTTQRSVTTVSDTGNFIVETSNLQLANTGVKNVRSVTTNNVLRTNYTDYTVDYDYTGNTCRITFTTPQTSGWSYAVQYDHGTDRIFTDFPRRDISISSFPRITVSLINIASQPGGFGNVNENRYDITMVAYDPEKRNVRSYIKKLRTWIVTNQNALHNLKVIKPTFVGPIGIGEFEKFKDRIFQQNIDFNSIYNLEVN
jgi:hypothetical protein